MKPLTLIGLICISLALVLAGVTYALQTSPPSAPPAELAPQAQSTKLARERFAESLASPQAGIPPIVEPTAQPPPRPPVITSPPTETPTQAPTAAPTPSPTVTADEAAPRIVAPSANPTAQPTARAVATAPPSPEPRKRSLSVAKPLPAPTFLRASRTASPAPRTTPARAAVQPRPRTLQPKRGDALDSAAIERLNRLHGQAERDAAKRAASALAAADPPGSHVRSATLRESGPGLYRILIVKEAPSGTIVEQIGLRATPNGFVQTLHRILPAHPASSQAPAKHPLIPFPKLSAQPAKGFSGG